MPKKPVLSFGSRGDFTSGRLPEGDYEITDAKVLHTDYDGKADAVACVVRLTFKEDDGEAEYDQMYSVGPGSEFAPGEEPEGDTIIAIDKRTTLNKSSNFYLLMESLWNTGWPEAGPRALSNDVSELVSTRVTLAEKPQPKRIGLVGSEGKTIMLVEKILKLPWEKGKGKAAVPAKGPRAPAKAKAKEAEEGGEENALAEVLMAVIDKPVSRAKARVLVMKHLAASKRKDAPEILALFDDEDTLAEAIEAAGLEMEDEEIRPEMKY